MCQGGKHKWQALGPKHPLTIPSTTLLKRRKNMNHPFSLNSSRPHSSVADNFFLKRKLRNHYFWCLAKMVPEFRDKHRKTWNLPKNILLVGTEARRQNISQLILGLTIPLAHCACTWLVQTVYLIVLGAALLM